MIHKLNKVKLMFKIREKQYRKLVPVPDPDSFLHYVFGGSIFYFFE
jgi:hypothetical protein